MARRLKASIKIEADTKGAKKGLGEVDKGVQKLEKSNRTLGDSFAGVSTRMAGFAAGIGVAAAAVFKLVGLVNQQEDSVQRLDAAFGNLDGSNQKLIDGLEKQNEVLSKLAKGGDEEIRAIQATIGLFVKEEETVKALTQATLDLAAAKGTDAKTAADQLTRTLVTENNALLEQGIVVEGAAGSVERFTSLMKSLEVFQGQAAAAADTNSAAINRLTNAFTDFLQASAGVTGVVGESTGALGLITGALDSATSGLEDLGKALRADAKGGFALLLDSIFPKFISRLINVDDGTKRFIGTMRQLREDTLRVGAATEAAAAETAKLAKAQEDADRIAKGLAEQEASVTLQLEQLGVVLESTVSKEVARLNVLLAAATLRFENGKLSSQGFQAVQLLVAQAIAKTNDAFATQNGLLSTTTTTQERYTQSLRQNRIELGLVTAAHIENRLAVQESTRAIEIQQRTIGGQGEALFEGGGPSGGTFSISEGTETGVNGTVSFVNRGGIFAR